MNNLGLPTDISLAEFLGHVLITRGTQIASNWLYMHLSGIPTAAAEIVEDQKRRYIQEIRDSHKVPREI